MIVDQRVIDSVVNDMEIEIPLGFPLLLLATTSLLIYFVWSSRDSE